MMSAAHPPHEPIVTVRRLIRAPVERVFAAWSDPATMALWMRPSVFAPSDVRLDFRVGGDFRIAMRNAGEEYLHEGTYTEIRAPERLVFTWRSHITGPTPSEVSIDFRTVGDGTELTLRHRLLQDERQRSLHTAGWEDIIGNLDRQLAGAPVVGDAAAAKPVDAVYTALTEQRGFCHDVTISAAAGTVYAALTEERGLRAWWTPTCDVGTGLGAALVFRFGATWKGMRIEALEPGRLLRWRCSDCHMIGHGLQREDEWVGTAIEFLLEPVGPAQTRLRFRHIGLVPQIECYAMCSAGWRQFLGSLAQYAETGRGTPYAGACTAGVARQQPS